MWRSGREISYMECELEGVTFAVVGVVYPAFGMAFEEQVELIDRSR